MNMKGVIGEGWFLLWMSLYELVMLMNLESDEVGGIWKVKNCLVGFFVSKVELKM